MVKLNQPSEHKLFNFVEAINKNIIREKDRCNFNFKVIADTIKVKDYGEQICRIYRKQ
ncbi:Uncharacterised protein [Streptococcus pneumoniae]|nr:Uncharacterised protein [Streptococcus pneumoniae]VKZ22617.1 Uncharacterised protein [Streptococcus pneumoniae]VLN86895.1 Uncharacterised protein [Streptococcus pneumoniae]VLU07825.1 Uncharacterised protein [Streptococcus pneumoniae]VOB16100.1 Uncharacterised protein [Streptococcus pneumoniae]